MSELLSQKALSICQMHWSGGESVRLTQTVTWTEDTGTVRSRCLVPSTFDLILMVA